MVQEASLRAFKFFNAFRGLDGRAWLLTIVRNTCYTWLQQNRAHEITTTFDEEIHGIDDDTSNPATLVLQSADHQMLNQAFTPMNGTSPRGTSGDGPNQFPFASTA